MFHNYDDGEIADRTVHLTGTEIEFEFEGDLYRGMILGHNPTSGQYKVTTSDDDDMEATEVDIDEEQITQIIR